MTENTNEQTISHRDAKLKDLREDIAELNAKIEKKQAQILLLEQEATNEAAIEALKQGDSVAYVYGRALNKRVLSGTVLIAGKTDKGAVQLKVQFGDGFDAEFHLIDGTSLLFTAEQVEAAQSEIDKAKADAAAEAAAKAAGEGGAK